nr:C552 [uncultured bacterium]
MFGFKNGFPYIGYMKTGLFLSFVGGSARDGLNDSRVLFDGPPLPESGAGRAHGQSDFPL